MTDSCNTNNYIKHFIRTGQMAWFVTACPHLAQCLVYKLLNKWV